MRMSWAVAALAAALGACAPVAGEADGWHLIAGSIPADRQPDGNTIVLDAPGGLVVVDTGRRAAHQQAILAFAASRRKPVAAIVNTHWHLDHTGGNAEVRAEFRDATIVASNAVDGALSGFLKDSREGALAYMASGKADAAQRAEIEGDIAAVDERTSMLPTRVVAKSGPMTIAGRTFDVRLARYAATEGDVWIYDEERALAVVGDLVVGPVPFMDTACVSGWQRALAEIAATPFTTLIPGHGAPMDRAAFGRWRAAFGNLAACAEGTAPDADCIAGWTRDAAEFSDGVPAARISELLGYYLKTRLRGVPEEQMRYCPKG